MANISKELEQELENLKAAKAKVLQQLEKDYPLNTPVRVMLRSGQYRPTNAVVVAHHGDGQINVRLYDRHGGTSYTTREIRPVDIVQVGSWNEA